MSKRQKLSGAANRKLKATQVKKMYCIFICFPTEEIYSKKENAKTRTLNVYQN